MGYWQNQCKSNSYYVHSRRDIFGTFVGSYGSLEGPWYEIRACNQRFFATFTILDMSLGVFFYQFWFFHHILCKNGGAVWNCTRLCSDYHVLVIDQRFSFVLRRFRINNCISNCWMACRPKNNVNRLWTRRYLLVTVFESYFAYHFDKSL